MQLTFNYHYDSDIPRIQASSGNYKFSQVHIHFGTSPTRGSEHSFGGYYAAAEIHAVFENTRPSSNSRAENYIVMTLMPYICENPRGGAASWSKIFNVDGCKVLEIS